MPLEKLVCHEVEEMCLCTGEVSINIAFSILRLCMNESHYLGTTLLRRQCTYDQNRKHKILRLVLSCIVRLDYDGFDEREVDSKLIQRGFKHGCDSQSVLCWIHPEFDRFAHVCGLLHHSPSQSIKLNTHANRSRAFRNVAGRFPGQIFPRIHFPIYHKNTPARWRMVLLTLCLQLRFQLSQCQLLVCNSDPVSEIDLMFLEDVSQNGKGALFDIERLRRRFYGLLHFFL